MVGNPTRVGAARVGDAVTCSGPDGKPYRCRVVERRLARGRSAALASGSLASGGRAGGAAAYEFYVHYDGMNGRMNGWVTEDQLVRGPPAPLTACTPGGEAAPPCAPLISLARGSVAESAAATTSAAEAGGGRPRAEPAEGALLSPAPGTRRMKRRLDELHRASASEPLLDPAEARERADEKAKVRRLPARSARAGGGGGGAARRTRRSMGPMRCRVPPAPWPPPDPTRTLRPHRPRSARAPAFRARRRGISGASCSARTRLRRCTSRPTRTSSAASRSSSSASTRSK